MKYGYCRVSTRGQAREGNSLEYQELLKETLIKQLCAPSGALFFEIKHTNMCCPFVAIKLIK